MHVATWYCLSLKDTRQKEEFQVSHLPGARHVEFDERSIPELAQSLDPARPGGWEGQRGRSRWVLGVGCSGWVGSFMKYIQTLNSDSNMRATLV